MTPAEFKRRLAAGEKVLLVNPDHVAPSLVQKLGAYGADAAFIDCEHGAPSFLDVEEMARAARLAGMISLVRPESHERALMTRYLHRGIDGLIVPLVHTAEQCRSIVETVRYACPYDHADKIIVVMIESIQGVDNLPAMLSVEEIDVFFIGPGDLSQSMGYLPTVHAGQERAQPVIEAVDRAMHTILSAGRAAGTLVNPGDIADFAGAGAQLLYLHVNELIGGELARLRKSV